MTSSTRRYRKALLITVIGVLLVVALQYMRGASDGIGAPRELALAGQVGGYRFDEGETTAVNSNRTLVALLLSGGGVRSSALAYGVLRELQRTRFTDADGRERNLLDEVDAVASVSGGSFTAAYLALFGADSLDVFEREFLKGSAQQTLERSAFSPDGLRRMLSRTFGRSDLAAELWDTQLFHGKTFASLIGRRPYLMINATDLAQGTQFTFTQEYFDPLCLDLGSYPIARAVAASSALPGLLSPMTLRSRAGRCQYRHPGWVSDVLDGTADTVRTLDVPVLRGTAQHIASYDDSLRRYIHFVDGALSDNLGGRVAYRALVANTDFSIMRVLEREAGVAHRVVVIVVDARPRERTYIEERADVPGEAAVLSSVFSIPMTRYSDETIFRLEERIDLMNQHDPRNQVGSRENRFYFTRVAMENVDDAATRLALNAIPTAFTIPAASVDRLVTAGGMLLRNAEGFKRLVADLRASRH